MIIDKTELLQAIIEQLSHDLNILFNAALTSHEAATHEENTPDNKYDTLALEASYVAQGQANRARQIRQSIELYKQLRLPESPDAQPGSLVTLEQADGTTRRLFLGPAEGGLKIEQCGAEIIVITSGSPMGRALLGKSVGDAFEIRAGGTLAEYEIIEVS